MKRPVVTESRNPGVILIGRVQARRMDRAQKKFWLERHVLRLQSTVTNGSATTPQQVTLLQQKEWEARVSK